MNGEKFKEILGRVDGDKNLNKDKIIAELQKEDPGTYKEGFDINYSFTVEDEPDNYTLLHLAVEHGYNKLVKFLLESGADVNKKSFGYVERTPLHVAALKGHTEAAKLLLNNTNKANVDEMDAYNETSLHLTARNGHKEMVDLLVKNKAKELLNHNDETPLDLAARNGHKDIVEFLLTNRANPSAEVNKVSLEEVKKRERL